MRRVPILAISVMLLGAAAPAGLEGPPLEFELQGLLKDDSAADRYPDAAIERLLAERRIVVNADGSYVETIRDTARILNKRGQEGWSEASEGYDVTHQTLTLDWARTFSPSGQRVAVAANAVKDAAPFADYPSYDQYRVKTWTFPATAPGAVVDYRATVHSTRPMLDGDFADVDHLADFQPSRRARYVVSMPKNKPLYHLLRNVRPPFDVNFEKVTTGGRVEYRWETRDVPYTLTEANMPPRGEFLPAVWVTTQPSWDAVAAWWRKMNDAKGAPSPAIRHMAARLTAGVTDPEARARAIYEWVVRNIRYVYVDMTYTGYESQSADDVLAKQYGDCKGGSTLLLALLRAADIRAHHALVRTSRRGPLVPDAPSLFQFNHCIVAAELPGGLKFLDNVGKTMPYGTVPAMDQGTTALVVTAAGPRFMTVPLDAAERNAVRTRRDIELDPYGGATVSVVVAYGGLQDSGQRADYQSLSPSKTREAFEARVSDESPNAALLDYQVTDPEDLGTPLEIRYRYRAPEFADRAGDLVVFRIPGYAPDMVNFERERRTFPLWSDALFGFVQEAEVTLPAGYRVRHVPAGDRAETPHLAFAGSYGADGRHIRFTSDTRYLAREVSPGAYPAMRDLVRRKALFGKGLVVLEKE